MSIQHKQILSAVIPAFILDRRTRGLTPGTVRYYRDELDRFCSWSNDPPVTSITPDLLRAYLDHLAQSRNHGGVHAAWRAIRALLHWYEAEFEPDGWHNPVHKIRVHAPSKAALPGVPLSVVQRLIDACDTGQALRDKTVFMLLLDTGCRASELVSLKVSDLDYLTGALRVRSGKGGKSRTVFLGSKSRRILRKYLRTRELEPDSPLIATDEGEHLTYNGLVDLVRRRSAEAGVERPRLHDFRRAFAVQMLRNGCDLARLAALLGHDTLDITRRYLKFVDEDLQLIHASASPADRIK